MTISKGGVKDTRLETKDTKKSEAKDSPSEDRPSWGQGQNAQGQEPRTQAQVFSKKKKGLQKNFLGDLKKKVFKIFFRRSLVTNAF